MGKSLTILAMAAVVIVIGGYIAVRTINVVTTLTKQPPNPYKDFE